MTHGCGCHWCRTPEIHAGPADCTPEGRTARVEEALRHARANPLYPGFQESLRGNGVRINALDSRGRTIW